MEAISPPRISFEEESKYDARDKKSRAAGLLPRPQLAQPRSGCLAHPSNQRMHTRAISNARSPCSMKRCNHCANPPQTGVATAPERWVSFGRPARKLRRVSSSPMIMEAAARATPAAGTRFVAASAGRGGCEWIRIRHFIVQTSQTAPGRFVFSICSLKNSSSNFFTPSAASVSANSIDRIRQQVK